MQLTDLIKNLLITTKSADKGEALGQDWLEEPDECQQSLLAEKVRQENKSTKAPTLIVLDDDPTGTQSVADLPVLTSWDLEDIVWALKADKPAIYVMTNSRSLSPQAAKKINEEIVDSVFDAGKQFPDKTFAFVSRSDSTLRGHFPLEPNVLAERIYQHTREDITGILLVPAFPKAGRITVGGTHYAGSLEQGFTPVGETEFAKDATFGYRNSTLSQWVEEKTAGNITAEEVIEIDLVSLRTDKEKVVASLLKAKNRCPIAVDIVTEADLSLLAIALTEAEARGAKFIYRVGPSFVRARIGQEPHRPLSPAEIAEVRQGVPTTAGGLIVVGSHVGLTTRQLSQLDKNQHPVKIELNVEEVLGETRREQYLSQIAELVTNHLPKENVVLYTSRVLVQSNDKDESLQIARRVSSAVVEVVSRVVNKVRPSFVLAKGGITSSDVASKGLGMRYAQVVGPMLDGIVSCWRVASGPAAGIPYIVFAGNVGDEKSLDQVVAKLATNK